MINSYGEVVIMTKGIGGVIEKRKYMNHENTVYRYGNIEFV